MILITIAQVNHAQEGKPANKHFWHTVTTSASPEDVWSIWTDVENWKKWDTGLKDASMSVPFDRDAKGQIISLEGRKSKFKVVEFDEGKSYTFKTNLPFGGLYVKRYLTSENGQTTFTHEVWFRGLTRGIFANAFGPKFREMLPDVMENIKKMAEK